MGSNGRRTRSDFNKKEKRAALLLILGLIMAAVVIVMPVRPVVMAVNSGGRGTSGHMGLVISEIISKNESAIPDEDGNFSDVIEICNTTDENMNLQNVGLSDRPDRIAFLFPDIVLKAGAYAVVFCDDTNADSAGSTFHAKFKISSLGETVYLFDASGVAINSVTVPEMSANESFSLTPGGQFEITALYSPGYENTPEGHVEYLSQYAIPRGDLLLNEIMPSPRTGIQDEDGEISDWVELYNNSERDIRLSGLSLSDDPLKPVKWVFPSNAVIPAHGYYLVFCSGKNKTESKTLYPHSSFSISAESETLLLSTVTGEILDSITVENIGRDMTYGRNPATLQWQVFTRGTPGMENGR